jgi:hypothetical protein
VPAATRLKQGRCCFDPAAPPIHPSQPTTGTDGPQPQTPETTLPNSNGPYHQRRRSAVPADPRCHTTTTTGTHQTTYNAILPLPFLSPSLLVRMTIHPVGPPPLMILREIA